MLPLIVAAMLLFVGLLAFVIDVTRDILAVQQLQFAAESAALDAFSKITSAEGTLAADRGLSNAQNAVRSSHGSSSWNTAPIGPSSLNGEYNAGVTIDSSDVNYAVNPSDENEPMLRVTARRSGENALRFFFLPAIFAMNLAGGSTIPEDAKTASPYRTIEVIGAPASRIGAGAPRTASAPSSLAGWAVLPLALSYSQYRPASSSEESILVYDLDLLDSTNPFVGRAPVGHLRAAFVNVLRNGDGYGTSQGNPAISELISTWRYFSASEDALAMPPAVVERGSRFSVFDCGDANFRSRRPELATVLSRLPTNRNYIVPVIASDPVVGQQSTVVGFAYLRLSRAVMLPPNQNTLALQLEFGASLPARNATSTTLATVPALTGALLPAPLSGGPFANRIFDSGNNSFSRRFRGVCMAPVVSARSL